jgi:retron-type reverse transcriptase
MAQNILLLNPALLFKHPLEIKLEELFSIENINNVFVYRISGKSTRGIDGNTTISYDIKKETEIINKKCVSGSYRFSPYLQKLISKGKGKFPRVISIPTIRDQIVIFILKEYLHLVFEECINNVLPNAYIRNICDYLKSSATDDCLCYSKFDVEDFYGSIDRDKLLLQIKSKIKSDGVVKILNNAISNITVSNATRTGEYKKHKTIKGIPQGLSISNILANIYVDSIDNDMKGIVSKYYRFVDDILIFNSGPNKQCIKPIIENKLKVVGLTISSSKTCCKGTSTSFDYLGYKFSQSLVSVKQLNVDKFIQSLVGKFTSFILNKNKLLKNHKWMTLEIYKQVFIEELNIKITGAIANKKRYGWVFYFIEINDLKLLKVIDNVINKQFKRLHDFGNTIPSDLKTLCRTYHEARYSPMSGYVHNYDNIITTNDKIIYLTKMGILNPDSTETLSVEQIDILFDEIKGKYLSQLELDIGGFS